MPILHVTCLLDGEALGTMSPSFVTRAFIFLAIAMELCGLVGHVVLMCGAAISEVADLRDDVVMQL